MQRTVTLTITADDADPEQRVTCTVECIPNVIDESELDHPALNAMQLALATLATNAKSTRVWFDGDDGSPTVQ